MSKKLMMNINIEDAKCYLCDDGLSHPLKSNGKEITDGQFGYAVHPVICDCGLVYLNPRWSKEDYDIFYSYYYDELYRLEAKPDYRIVGVIKNMEIIWERIKDCIPMSTKHILDIGCGSGHGLKLLRDKIQGSMVYGIESSPECCETLQSEEIGGVLASTDVDSNWDDEFVNKFDLIVMRHVVEHFLNPIESLKKISKTLTDDGFVYIATPNMMEPRVVLRDYDNWIEYWFRVVHTYYYSKETLFKTLLIENMYPVQYGETENEIWCLLSKKEHYLKISQNIFNKQIEILNKNTVYI
jgi:2-polyprenyl-3-methyl-5-hydroxy-6-metoxy-1,4-benzoquinol methylase